MWEKRNLWAAKAIDNTSLRKELEAKKRLSDLGRAASCVIHDLKQPINVVSGVTKMLKRPDLKEEKRTKMTSFLDSATTDMLDFVNDILEFSHDKQLDQEKLEVGKLIQQIISEYELSHQRDQIEISLNLVDPTYLLADKSQLRRSIKNLVNNAAEALISLRVEKPEITLGVQNGESNITITVRDNGPGIPEEIRETLLEPFVTKGKASGTGLGLAITEKMIRLNHGEIDFTSSSDGTEFRLRFASA